MLKSLMTLALSLVVVAQAHASAFDSLNDQKLQEQAMTLLQKNADTLSMNGNVLPGEKLSSILKLVTDYNDEILSQLEIGEGIENLKSPVASADTSCAVRPDEKTAGCSLMITFKGQGDIKVDYEVELDSDKNAVSVMSDVLVTRGY